MPTLVRMATDYQATQPPPPSLLQAALQTASGEELLGGGGATAAATTTRPNGSQLGRSMGEHHQNHKEAAREKSMGPGAVVSATQDKEKKRREAERLATLERGRAESTTPGGPEAETDLLV